MQLSAQVDELHAGDSKVEAIFPDGLSLTAFGDNMMDQSTRRPAGRAGFDQGAALGEQVRDFRR